MTLDAFHTYKELYEDFFETGFKRVPKHNIIAEYPLVEGSVRIERNAHHWYFYTPETLSEWELFTLIEVRRAKPATLVQINTLIRELAARKGITLSSARQNLLLTLYREVTTGYGIIERLLKDERVLALKLTCLNTLCTLYVTHAEYHDCQTNISPHTDLVMRIVAHLRNAGCTDDGTCSTQLAHLDVHATLNRQHTSALETIRIELQK